MKLKDTVYLMTSDRYEDRLVGEYAQLIIRISKLENFLVKYSKKELKMKLKANPSSLFSQYMAMIYYAIRLKVRIAEEGIDIFKHIPDFELPVVYKKDNVDIFSQEIWNSHSMTSYIWEDTNIKR